MRRSSFPTGVGRRTSCKRSSDDFSREVKRRTQYSLLWLRHQDACLPRPPAATSIVSIAHVDFKCHQVYVRFVLTHNGHDEACKIGLLTRISDHAEIENKTNGKGAERLVS